MPATFSHIRALVLMCLAVLICCAVRAEAAAAQDSRIRAVSYTSGGDFEKVIITLSSPAAYRANVLERNTKANMPCRLYVDFINTTFAPGVNRRLSPKGGCVRVVRSALNDPRTARVVLELSHALSADEYTIIKHDSPPSLEIILNPKKATVRTAAVPERARDGIVEKPVSAAPAAADKQQPEPTGPRSYLIAVDAGHGGRDPGAIGHHGLREKKICLAIALALKKVLDERPGYTTVMTRTTDRSVPLQSRGRIANDSNADLFISIHANAHVDARLDGIETYYLNFSSDAEARRVAARENFTTPEEIGDLEMILFDLMQSDKSNISSLLAGYVHNKLTAAITGRYTTLRNLGIKHAPMRVLIDAEMPGILFEAGFISNPEEARRLQIPAHQQLLAEAIADGIHDFFTSSKTAAYRAQEH